jgi:hypothetical protein
MGNLPNHDFEAIAEFERQGLECVRAMSVAERSEMLAVACRDAEEIEASRLKMGFGPSQPAPWPDSTWTFLAEAALRVRQQ